MAKHDFLGTETERFWRKIRIIDSGCWEWIGAKNPLGYGLFTLDGRKRRNTYVFAHRWSYLSCVGPIPTNLELDHLCRNSSCVNPLHLEAVTHLENLKRGSSHAGNALRTNKCINGHDLTGDNVYRTKKEPGTRRCRICRRLLYMDHYWRHKAKRKAEK